MAAETTTAIQESGLAVLSQSLDQLTQIYCRLLEGQSSLDYCQESGRTIRCLISQLGRVLQAFDDGTEEADGEADEFDLGDEIEG